MSGLFPNLPPIRDDDRRVIDLYASIQRTLDDLPYTQEFERLFDSLGGDGAGHTRHDVLHRLHNLRKAGKLPRVGRAASTPPRTTPEEEQTLRDLVVDAVGTLGQRDQLLYTDAFAALVQTFNAKVARNLSEHDVWRLIAKLAK